MTQSQQISVVIPAYNAAATIGGQLRALAEQRDAPPFEVVVADNRSTDGTREAALAWAERFPGGLRVVTAERAQNVSHARNAGIQEAAGQYILLCDADDVVSPNWVCVLDEELATADVVGTVVRTDDGRTMGPVFQIMNYLPSVLGGSRGMHRAVWEAIGGFDESFPAGHEEVDFDWRAQEAGFVLSGTTRTFSTYSQRSTLRALRRQRRAYAQGWMLLWVRFADARPLPPISFVGSLRGYPGDLLRALATLRPATDEARRRAAWERLGWAEGIILGHLRYRIGPGPGPRALNRPTSAVEPEGSEITVVIPHYGEVRTTQRLLRGLAAQSGPGPVPVVVVDDASPERFEHGDAPTTGEVGGQPGHAGIRVEVVHRETNGGFGTAVNTGLARVRTPWALVLNTDLEIPEDLLERLSPARLPEVPAVASPRVLGTDGAQQWVGRRFPRVGHQVAEWLTPLARFRETTRWHELVGHDTGSAGPGTHPVDWVMGAALLLPVEAVRAVHGFDERFFMNGEEVDLQRRLREIGVRSWVIGDLAVRHVGGGSSNPLRRRRWLVASRFRYARKWGGEARLRAGLRAATLVNFGHQLLRRTAGREVSPWRMLREEWSLTSLDERGRNG